MNAKDTYAFFEVKENWERKLFSSAFPRAKLLFFEEPLGEEHIDEIRECTVISVFVHSHAAKEVLSKLGNLKVVVTRSTGFDHVDISYCREHGIAVYNVPSYGEHTVAEFAMAMLLCLSRHVHASIQRTKVEGSFSFDGLRGFDLHGRSVGLLGFGRISQVFARICKGFGMEVYAYDPFKDKLMDRARELGVKFLEFDEILSNADILSLHLPSNEHTQHLLNASTFAKMKDGVYLLNTSRGEIIDTAALIHALDSGKVAGCALDVLEGECYIGDELELLHEKTDSTCDIKMLLENHYLMKHPRVLITPHNAFNTQDALERIASTTVQNMKSFLLGSKGKENRIV